VGLLIDLIPTLLLSWGIGHPREGHREMARGAVTTHVTFFKFTSYLGAVCGTPNDYNSNKTNDRRCH
jgi:hypothetical protein